MGDSEEVFKTFQSALADDQSPNIADYVQLLDTTKEPGAIHRLIAIELDSLLHRDQTPLPDRYAQFGHDAVTFATAYLSEASQQKSNRNDPTQLQPTVVTSDPGIDTPTVLGTECLGTAIASGSKVGEYVIQSEIARGGMGVVYKAHHPGLGRTVAMKMILNGRQADPELIERFQIEAKAAAKLRHPGIVPIYDIGTHQDQWFFTMAYVSGESLADKVRDTSLSPREAAQITRQVAEAMSHAHDQGVVHRDLKPSNILVGNDGKTQITDFGLARTVEDESELTQSGAVLGTPSYMSPEQASGQLSLVGPAADIYAIGGILYRLVTGRPPFQSANVIETLRQVVEREPVSPQTLNPEVDDDLQTLSLKCLEKNIEARPESADFLAQELTRYLNGEPILSRRPSSIERLRKWCARNRAEAAVIVMAMIIVTLGTGLFAVAGLPYLTDTIGNQAMRSTMIAFAFSGPILSMVRLCGLSGPRSLEDVLMKLGKNCLCAGHSILTAFAIFTVLLSIIAIFVAFTKAIDDPEIGPVEQLLVVLVVSLLIYARDKRSFKRMWACFGLAVLCILISMYLPVFEIPAFALLTLSGLYAGLSLAYYQLRIVHYAAHRYATSVKRVFGWVPWPISRAKPEYRPIDALVISNCFPIVILIGAIQLVITAILPLVAIPLWAAEQLRLILFPESEIRTETLGYGLSIGCLVALGISSFQ